MFESGDLRDGTTLGQNLSVLQDMVPLRRGRMRGGVLRLPFWTCRGIYSDWGRLNRCSFEEVYHHDATYNCDHPCFILGSSFARAVDVNHFVVSYVMYCISLPFFFGLGCQILVFRRLFSPFQLSLVRRPSLQLEARLM